MGDDGGLFLEGFAERFIGVWVAWTTGRLGLDRRQDVGKRPTGKGCLDDTLISHSELCL